MKLSRRYHAGYLVKPGPSGAPPAGMRGFEVVDAKPTIPPGLLRPAGSVVVLRDGSTAFVNHDGTATGWFEFEPAAALANEYLIGGRLEVEAAPPWEPAVDATSHDFPVDPTKWRSLRMVICATPTPLVNLRVDAGATPAGSFLRVVSGEAVGTAAWSVAQSWWNGEPALTGAVCEVFFWLPTVVGARARVTVLSDRFYTGACAAPTVSVGVDAAVGFPFTGNATRVELWGVPV